MPNLGNLVLALLIALLTNWFSNGSIWPREEGITTSDLAKEVHALAVVRPAQAGVPSGLDPYELAQEAEDAVGGNNREVACRVKNAFRNLSVPGTHWVKRSVIRRFAAIRARLDALCPVLDPIQLPVSLGLRGAL